MIEAADHGGGVLAAAREYPHAPQPWLDLSTGINPRPYSAGHIPEEAWTRLPQREEIAALEQAAAEAYGASEPASVVAAPGTQALIQLLPRLFPARRVAVVGPTYSEHERRWRAGGADVSIVPDLDATEGFDAVVLVNPNNPDGRVCPVDRIAREAESCSQHGGLLVIDEAFMDAMPAGLSFVPHLSSLRVVVLRSFGKFFGLAGLRLGFAVAPPMLVTSIRDALGPWPVSGPAVAIGARALRDPAWRDLTKARLAEQGARLDALLAQAGLGIVGRVPLFRLAQHPQAAALHVRLCRAGILARIFPDQPTWIRFGLPAQEHDWDRLRLALRAY